MKKTLIWCLIGLFSLGSAARSQARQASYLDVYIAKLKPEKATEAEAIAKKITDANRHNNGDHVVVEQPVYGDPYTLIFVSQRDYAMWIKAATLLRLSTGLRQEAQKVFNDWNNCLVSARSQLRIRRADLSSKMPADPQLLPNWSVNPHPPLCVTARAMMEFETQIKETPTPTKWRTPTRF
jgi:hypothetical protein